MRAFLVLLVFYGAFSLWAQVHSFLSVDCQNDFFDLGGHGSDRYYTSGNTLSFTKVQSSRHQVLGFSISQQTFTPSDLQDTVFFNVDYPYAGLLYLVGGYQWVLPDSSFFMVATASFGSTGKYSGVAGVQRTLHRVFHDEMPRGWNTILELGFFSQSRIGVAKRILLNRRNTLVVTKSLEWGSVYKKIILGAQGSMGNLPPFSIERFTSPTYSPSVGYSKRIFQRFSCYIYPTVTWVISNTILEKGLPQNKRSSLNYSSSNIIHSLVIDLECGFSLDCSPFLLQFRQNWQTAETRVSAPHHFGAITAMFKIPYRRR